MNENEKNSVLVWLDLEMTGLDINTDVILEIATIITDWNLNTLAAGPELIIFQPEITLDRMDDWCKKQHKSSGLTDAVLSSNITLNKAEADTLDFIQHYAKPNSARLCGNSIWQDRIFLQKYMPKLHGYLSYRMVDVSSIKELVKQWYPKNPNTFFKKKDLHRAMPDVLESIEELKQYRANFFV